MATFLFNEIIFGPVSSRRLGVSLGINLLPIDKKYCNFDCLYCECGWTCNTMVSSSELPSRESVKILLTAKLRDMDPLPDVITFAGNGEPTIHPEFPGIIDDTIELRNKLCPDSRIAVLSNSTNLGKTKVFESLRKVDQPILKLDTAIEDSYRLINRPAGLTSLEEIIKQLAEFGNHLIIQTLFFRGSYKDKIVDNTTELEISSLLDAYKRISPAKVMIYTFERDTPLQSLKKIPLEELKKIGEQIRASGFEVEISG